MTDTPISPALPLAPAHKQRLSKFQRLFRFLSGVADPRAWAHMLKVVNQYNYSHVAPLRQLKRGPGAEISPNAILSNAQNITAGARLHLGANSAVWAGPTERGRIVLGDDVGIGPARFHDGGQLSIQRRGPGPLQRHAGGRNNSRQRCPDRCGGDHPTGRSHWRRSYHCAPGLWCMVRCPPTPSCSAIPPRLLASECAPENRPKPPATPIPRRKSRANPDADAWRQQLSRRSRVPRSRRLSGERSEQRPPSP